MRLPRFRIRTLMIAVAIAAALVAGLRSLEFNNANRRKVSYCRGGAAAHMATAMQLQKELADSAQTHETAAAIRLAIKRQRIIARKYIRVADDPSLPYPSAPFITPAELASEPCPVSPQ